MVCVGSWEAFVDDWESKVSASGYFGESFGVLDIIVYCYSYNLFRYVMVPTWRDAYPKISTRECE